MSFAFTETETRDERLTHERFIALLDMRGAQVHSVQINTNNYGEFLFVIVSLPAPDGARLYRTFWGLGFHEARERWMSEYWRWYDSQFYARRPSHALDKTYARVLIDERRIWVLAESAVNTPPSARAQLFAVFAGETDDDGATTMLEDLVGHLTGM